MKRLIGITIFIMLYLKVFSIETQPLPVLSYSLSTKANAVGNSYNSLAWDVFNTFLNPSINGILDKKNVGFTTGFLYENTFLSCIGYLHPTLSYGNFSSNIIYLGSFGARETDEYNRFTGREFGYTNIISAVGWGKEIIIKKLYFGGNIKFVIDSIPGSYSRSFFTTTLGGIYRLNNFYFASNINNLLNINLTSTEDRLPVGFNFGIGIKPFESLSIGIDAGRNKNLSSLLDTYSFGLEWHALKILYLRAGKSNLETSFGIGLTFKNLSFDYAAVLQEYLGVSHRISLDFKFGKTLEELWAEKLKSLPTEEEMEIVEAKLKTEEERRRYFQVLFEEAIKNYNSGSYKTALTNLAKAKEIYPDAKDIDIYIEKIKLITSLYSEILPKDKINRLLVRGITFFINGDNTSAVKVINYALSLNPEDKTVLRLLNLIEEKTGVRAEKIESPIGITIVDKLHNESLIAFRKRDYAQVVKLCEEILLLEPEDISAYKRLGSALFAMGEREKAVNVWEQALRLNPQDDKLRKLIDSIKK